MTLIRRRWKNADGKYQYYPKYTIKFLDHKGVEQRITAFSSKTASAELERTIQKMTTIRQINGVLGKNELQAIESLPQDVVDKLANIGIIPAEHANCGKPLTEQADEWKSALEIKGDTPKHIKEHVSYVLKASKKCKWVTTLDISLSDYREYIKALKGAGKSHSTLNHHIRAAKSFCRWMKTEKRITENPLEFFPIFNTKLDVRHYRRAMTVEELSILLSYVESCGTKHHGLDAHARALLYHTAAHTGFRWTECYYIERGGVELGGKEPSVFLPAQYTKNRKDALLPLTMDLFERFQTYFHAHPMLPKARVFQGMWKDKGFEMLRKDIDNLNTWHREQSKKLEKGKGTVEDLIPWETDDGVLDFHAFRTTFGTMLNQSGVQLVTAQKLMRHSDPKLTANFYTRVVIQDQQAAINKLAPLKKSSAKNAVNDDLSPEGPKNVKKASGTKITVTSMDTKNLETGGKSWNEMEDFRYKKAAGAEHENHEKSPANSVFCCPAGLRILGAKKEIRTPDLLSHSQTL